MLTVQAASAFGAATTGSGSPPEAAVRSNPVILVDQLAAEPNLVIDSPASVDAVSMSTQTRSATAEVMNLPAQPIPTPPAFAMGLTVIAGLAGYHAIRRLRAA